MSERHRLLRQTDGFEGLVFVLVETYAGDLMIVNRENERAPRRDLDPVATTLVSHVRNDNHVAGLYKAVRLDEGRLEGFVVLGVEAQRLVEPSIHAGERSSRCGPVQLQTGMVERSQGV